MSCFHSQEHSGNRNEFTFEKITFENHTKCGCRSFEEDSRKNSVSLSHMKLSDQPAQMNRIVDKFRDNYYDSAAHVAAPTERCALVLISLIKLLTEMENVDAIAHQVIQLAFD
uniref:Uncharacterized protein n=1 Tax=Megaselia scalaris TaxID=36166 RepID=T1GYU7_MEGSC